MQLQKSFADNHYFLLLCIIGVFAILSSTMSKSPVLNPFATSLGTPNDLIGFVAAASTIPGILISLPAASLSDIIGRRKVLLVSAFIFASAPFLYLLVGTWWQLAIVRFFHGFATATFVPVTETLIAERYPSKRGERISLLNSATGIGRVAAPILGGSILALTNFGYNTLYLAVGIAGTTTFILTFFLREKTKKSYTKKIDVRITMLQMFQGWRKIVKNRNVIIVSLVQASQYYTFGAFEFFIVGYIIEVAKLDAFIAGVILTAQIATIIITRPIFGVLSDKKGRITPIFAGSLLSAVLLLTIPFTIHFIYLLLIAIGYGLGFAMVVSSTAPFMSELAPANLIGSSMGFLYTTMDIGQTLGPVISGIILATTLQYTGLFASLSLILFASSIIFVFYNKIRNKKKPKNQQ